MRISVLCLVLLALIHNASAGIKVRVVGVSDGKNDGEAQDILEATLDAKVKAIEKIGVTISSTTEVQNYMVQKDIIESKAKAFLEPGFELVELGYDSDGKTYKVVLVGTVSAEPQAKSYKIQYTQERGCHGDFRILFNEELYMEKLPCDGVLPINPNPDTRYIQFISPSSSTGQGSYVKIPVTDLTDKINFIRAKRWGINYAFSGDDFESKSREQLKVGEVREAHAIWSRDYELLTPEGIRMTRMKVQMGYFEKKTAKEYECQKTFAKVWVNDTLVREKQNKGWPGTCVVQDRFYMNDTSIIHGDVHISVMGRSYSSPSSSFRSELYANFNAYPSPRIREYIRSLYR